MEKVLTGSDDCSAIDATTELESIPPLRNAPSGTSAIIRMRTDSSNNSRIWQAASSLVRSAGERSAGAGKRQYRPPSTRPSASKVIQPPGGTFLIFLNGVRGSGM